MTIVRINKLPNHKEYESMEVKAHYIYSNGIDFISRYGLIFVPNGDYEIIADYDD